MGTQTGKSVNLDYDLESTIAISDALMTARHELQLLPEFPGIMPETLEAAYAVQARSIEKWNDKVTGWKVGGVPAAYLDRFSDKRLVGPIFAKNTVYSKEGATSVMQVFDGFAAVEGEFVFCIGATPQQDTLHIGVEIASSPLHEINDMGPIAVICDFGNNRGLIVGPEIENWQTLNPEPFEVKTEIDGEIVGTKIINPFPGDGIEALAFMRDHAIKNDMPLPVGTYVSSGAITGVHATKAGAKSTVDFGPFGILKIELVPAKREN